LILPERPFVALVDTQEVKLAISTETIGTAAVSTLAEKVEALARSGTEAAPEFARLAAELRKLDEQQIHVDGLQAAIAGAKQARASFSEARAQVQTLDKALADAKGANAGRAAIKLLETELRKANTALAGAERNWNRQNAALKNARTAAAATGVDTRNLAKAQTELTASVDRTRASITAQVESVNRARKAEADRATDLKRQAAEEDRLAATVAASKRRLAQAAQEQLAAEKRAWAESAAAAKRYAADTANIANSINSAFKNIGIRSTAQIQAEILKINQSLGTLARNAKGSGADFNRAFAAAQPRLQALQAELRGVTNNGRSALDPFTQSVGRASGGIGGLVTKLRPLAGAIAAAFGAGQIARAVVEFDSLNRTLRAITGNAQGAAREIGYITATANRLGLELGSASTAYARFMAVTKGTALEGAQAREVFEAVAGSMAVLGRSAADTDGAMLALSQMVSKGVVSMEELRQQLAERLPGAMQAAARGAGLTEAELIKMVESGQVLAEDLLPAMARHLKELYNTSGQIDGYSASWNRLTAAFKESAGELGQTRAVSDTATGGMWLLTKSVQGLGLVITGASEALSLLGVTIGTVGAAIANWDFSNLKDSISEAAEESGARLQILRDRFLGVESAADKAGQAASSAAAAAMAGNPGWLGAANAYAQARTAVEAYSKQSEKALQARQAEAKAIIEHAQTLGDEVRLRNAEAEAAIRIAAASDQMAAAKFAEAETLRSQIIMQEAIVAATEAESSAKQKLIAESKNRLEQLTEESAALRAAADAAAIDAAAKQAQAEATRDHAAQLDVMRSAYASAVSELQRFTDLERKGLATQQQLAEARAAATRAAILYNDAIADSTRRLNAQATAQTHAVNTELALARIKREQAQTSVVVAEALGNERAAMWANVNVKRQEIVITREQAALAVSQARNAVVIAEHKLKEATARGENVDAMNDELTASRNALEMRMLEQNLTDESIRKIEAEISAMIRRSQQSTETNTQVQKGAEQAGDAVEKAGKKGKSGLENIRKGSAGASGGMDGLGRSIKYADANFERLLKKPGVIRVGLTEPLLKGAAAASKYAAEAERLIKTVYEDRMSRVRVFTIQSWSAALNTAYALADRKARNYINTLEDLDRQQKRVDSSARDSLEERKFRLLELDGSEEQVERARADRERNQVERELALMEIELRRARIRGESENVERIQEDLRFKREELVVLAQIHSKEAAQAKERRAEEKREAEERRREEREQRREEERLARAENANQPASTQRTPEPAQPASRHELVLRLGGRSTTIGVNSEADVAAFTSFMSALEDGMRRAS
jgi:tape measure domain-containing protein